jgi:biopolymer transport protein TolR
MSLTDFSSRSNKKRSTISDINITPFVDILLVLLIIFMVCAPMMSSGIKINLPKGSQDPISESNTPISISIKHDGSIYLQDKIIKINQLNNNLSKLTTNNFDTKIFVRADKSIDYGKVMDVVSLIGIAGFSKVILVTDIAK